MTEKVLFFSGDECRDLKILEDLYEKYYVSLCMIAERIVRDPHLAEEIVSDVFLNFWNKRDSIVITHSVKSYLFQSTRNTSINHIKSRDYLNRASWNLGDGEINSISQSGNLPVEKLFEEEIFDLMEKEIHALPVSCRKIFLLSRERDLTYHQIASVLDISVNTVKTQIKIALQRLRSGLKNHLLSR